MKYTRTYEDFINGIVDPYLLTFKLIELIKNHIRKDWDVYNSTQQSIDKKNDDIIYISIDPNDLGGSPNFINLYYNSKIKMLMLAIIPQTNAPDLVDIQNFLEHIFPDYADERRNYITTMKDGTRFWIELDKIKNVIDEINDEAFDFFTNVKKYNL